MGRQRIAIGNLNQMPRQTAFNLTTGPFPRQMYSTVHGYQTSPRNIEREGEATLQRTQHWDDGVRMRVAGSAPGTQRIEMVFG